MFGETDKTPDFVDNHVEAIMEDTKDEPRTAVTGEVAELTSEDRIRMRRINLRFDLTILPMVSIMNFLLGLDKGNLGNAEVGGFSSDLGINPNVVNNSLTLFYITFLIFQPVNVYIGRRIGVRFWMGTLMFVWGIFILSHAFVKTYAETVAFRLMIGVAEAGWLSLATFYMSNFYSPGDFALRVGLVYTLSGVAGAFTGVFSYFLNDIRGRLHGWQYLFIVEGTITMLCAVICCLALPEKASTAWMLSADDREFIRRRQMLENPNLNTWRPARRDLIETAKDLKLWLVLPLNIIGGVPVGLLTFLPVVLEGFGFQGNKANLMFAPPILIGVIGLAVISWSSDHFKDRGIHLISTLFVALLGNILVIILKGNVGRYIALCILLIGSFAVTPLTATWLAGNTPEPGKRALVLGVSGLWYLAGLISAQLFLPKFAPDYILPLYVCLGLNIADILGYAGYWYWLRHVNKVRRAKVSAMTPAQIEEEKLSEQRLGDNKYTFQYQT